MEPTIWIPPEIPIKNLFSHIDINARKRETGHDEMEHEQGHVANASTNAFFGYKLFWYKHPFPGQTTGTKNKKVGKRTLHTGSDRRFIRLRSPSTGFLKQCKAMSIHRQCKVKVAYMRTSVYAVQAM